MTIKCLVTSHIATIATVCINYFEKKFQVPFSIQFSEIPDKFSYRQMCGSGQLESSNFNFIINYYY